MRIEILKDSLLRKLWLMAAGFGLAGMLTVARAATTATPGTLNYVEGQVSIDGQTVTTKDIGTAQLSENQVLETGQGKAEVLLTPGVFLRVGENSTLRAASMGLADIRVELVRGEALVEVTELFKGNDIRILEGNSSTRLLKNGLYRFDAGNLSVSVLDGKAQVSEGDQTQSLKKGREIQLQQPKWKAVKFDRTSEDSLYAWSELRSNYVALASMQTSRTLVGSRQWYGPGWYWAPYWSMFSYIPGHGIFYSPFGGGFYSTWPGYYGPVFTHDWRGGYHHGFGESFHGSIGGHGSVGGHGGGHGSH